MKPSSFKKAFFTLSCILAFASSGLHAQPTPHLSQAMKKARQQFTSLHYAEASRQLKVILENDSTLVPAQEMLAYSYRMLNDYRGSLKWYQKLVQHQPVKPEWALYYAEALAHNEQYESSEGWYRKYVSFVPADRRAAVFARTNSSNFKSAGNWMVNYTNINTQSSEYAPVFYKEGLIFSSNRPTGVLSKQVFLWDNTPFTNLYSIKNLSEIKPVDPDLLKAASKNDVRQKHRFNDDDTSPTSNDTRNLGIYHHSIQKDTLGSLLAGSIQPLILTGKINTKFHEAAAAIFPDGSIMFTRNNYFNGRKQTSLKGINKLKLYTASGGHLSKLVEFPYNSNEYSNGHPALNKEGNLLVFASDRPGGYGGTDLYYCVRSGKGQWSKPINLGKQINTEGNEMFPFLDHTGLLYFASTGHPGLGGLDLFEVMLKEMTPQGPPKNMGAPFNSSKDDFGLTRRDNGRIGYFSSNRRGNDDIYEFKRSSRLIILEGTVTDGTTRIPLANTRLLMRYTDGIDTLITDAKGKFKRELPTETDFETTTNKAGYINKLSFVTSQGIDKDSLIVLNIQLNKIESEQQLILNKCDSLKNVFAVKNIYYNLDRSEIRKDAIPALDELYMLMKKYPEISIITASHCDSRASEEYNKNLSLKRGHTAKNHLVAKGIEAHRISVQYYGKTRMLNRCFESVPCSEEEMQLNRRTEFDVILKGINLSRHTCD